MNRGLVVAALALTVLGITYAVKDQCTDNDWHDDYQYRHYCYSDILPLWFAHGIDQGDFPYLEHFNEYPVLTGLFEYAVGSLTDDIQVYMNITFAVLLAAGAAVTWALYRIAGPKVAVTWAVAPAIVVHGLTNWDLLAVAAAVLGWLAWSRKQAFLSAFAFGLGGSFKLYGAFWLPFLFIDAVRARDAKKAAAVAGGGTLGFVVPNAFIAVQDFDAWLATYRFHGDRHPDFETPWEAFLRPMLQPLFPGLDWSAGWRDFVSGFTTIAMALTLGVLLWRLWKGRVDPLVAGGVLTLVFTLVNKVYSPQYTLWLLPLLLLMRARWLPLAGWLVFDTINFLVRYNLFTPKPGTTGWNTDWLPWSEFAVNLRWLFLAWAFASVLVAQGLVPRDLWRRTYELVAQPFRRPIEFEAVDSEE